jgi:hypothetical protein
MEEPKTGQLWQIKEGVAPIVEIVNVKINNVIVKDYIFGNPKERSMNKSWFLYAYEQILKNGK